MFTTGILAVVCGTRTDILTFFNRDGFFARIAGAQDDAKGHEARGSRRRMELLREVQIPHKF